MAFVTKATNNEYFRMKVGSMPDFSGSKMIDQETPTGACNGTNTEFNLTNSPIRYSEKIHKDGMLMKRASDKTFNDGDYFIDYQTARLYFSVLQTPQENAVILADYKYY